jgi:hypothetical protein
VGVLEMEGSVNLFCPLHVGSIPAFRLGFVWFNSSKGVYTTWIQQIHYMTLKNTHIFSTYLPGARAETVRASGYNRSALSTTGKKVWRAAWRCAHEFREINKIQHYICRTKQAGKFIIFKLLIINNLQAEKITVVADKPNKVFFLKRHEARHGARHDTVVVLVVSLIKKI